VTVAGHAGGRYHAVGEEGVALRDIAEVIGAGLKMPVASITPKEAPEYFGWLAHLAQSDLAASGVLTRKQLGRSPTGSDLLSDLRNLDYSAAERSRTWLARHIRLRWNRSRIRRLIMSSLPTAYTTRVAIPLPTDDELVLANRAKLALANDLNVARMLAGTDDMFDSTIGIFRAVF
jgi:hypothetical protein